MKRVYVTVRVCSGGVIAAVTPIRIRNGRNTPVRKYLATHINPEFAKNPNFWFFGKAEWMKLAKAVPGVVKVVAKIFAVLVFLKGGWC